jgi:hypothetical protein
MVHQQSFIGGERAAQDWDSEVFLGQARAELLALNNSLIPEE